MPIYIRGFGLRVADNEIKKERDPHSFELLAKIEGVNLNDSDEKKRYYEGIDVTGLTRLHSEQDMIFDENWEIMKFILEERKCCYITEIKVLITSLRCDIMHGKKVSKDWMQIG